VAAEAKPGALENILVIIKIHKKSQSFSRLALTILNLLFMP